MDKKLNYLPDSPGLYICQRKTDILIVKIVGVFPYLSIHKGYQIDSLITGQQLKEASKEQLANIEVNPTEWVWQGVPVDTTVFPKTAFSYNRNDFSKDEYYLIRERYYRLINMGVGYSKILRSLVYEYNLSMDMARILVNEFDEHASKMQ